MSGQLFEVNGQMKWVPQEACPKELRGTIVHLKSKDGQMFEVDAEVACMSGRVRHIILKGGPEAKEPIIFPLKAGIVAKVVEYCKHHREHPPHEIRTPLESDNLQACGASRWDAAFIAVERETLFEILLAASCMEIPSLFMLASAKAATATSRKSSRKLRLEFHMENDLSSKEEAELRREYDVSLAAGTGAGSRPDFISSTAWISGMALANETHGLSEENAISSFSVSSKSWKQACWRALAMQDWRHLANAPPEVRSDRELMKAAVMSSNGVAFKYASAELRKDPKLVLEAVKCFGSVFREASEELRNNREFVLQAVSAHSLALAGASDMHREDRSLLREAASRGRGSALQGASMALRSDRDFVLELIAQDAEAFAGATAELQGQRDFCLAAAKVNGSSLKYMAQKFRADLEIVQAAVKDNSVAVHYAHASRRSEMFKPTWATPQEAPIPVETARAVTAGPRQSGLTNSEQRGRSQTYSAMKLQKSVNFSALSTMSANMGQSNYVAANSYLDKLPGFQRPHIDAVTLMWGAVGGIGMRYKAFAENDVLNKTPEALLSILDCCKILYATCCRVETPEWYACSFFDEWTQQYLLQKSAGTKAGTSEGWKPSEDAGRWEQEREERDAELERETGIRDGRKMQQIKNGAASAMSPLGGWPALARHLEEGAKVRLVGLKAKNGLTGVLVQKFSDGKWKVKLDDNTGNALLRSSYFEMIASLDRGIEEPGRQRLEPLADFADDDSCGLTAADIRRAKIEDRRANLREKMAARKQVPDTSLFRLKTATSTEDGVMRRREFLIAGSWDNFTIRSMLWNATQGCYTFQIQIGANGWEGFQILLDRSWNACLHPDPGDLLGKKPGSRCTLQGPEPKWKCDGQMWKVGEDGCPGSKYEIRLFATSTGHWEALEWSRLSEAVAHKGSAALREVSTTPPGSIARDDADSPSASASE